MSREPLPTRTRPSGWSLLSALAVLSSIFLCLASPASSQYMAITTDNPADSLQLNPSGTTVLTITLDTSHDRDGSVQSCNSHTNARACGIATAQPLDLFSYTITLSASGGTVSWGTFQAMDPGYTLVGTDLADDHQTEFSRGLPAGAITPAGPTTLGTISVTVTSGTPRIDFASGAQPLNPFGFGTGFGTECDANNFPNTYILGDLWHACATGDWFDVDGVPRVPAPPPDSAPTLNPIADMTVREGLTADQAISGSDPDGDALTFSKIAGPSFMAVGTTSSTTGNVHLATQFLDAGGYATARASDGLLSDDHRFTILVCQPCTRGPMLAPIADMTINEGESANQTVTATDPDGATVAFTKMSGPSYMTVTTTVPNAPIVTGNISLTPHGTDSGVYTAKVSAGFGDVRSSWAFTITVNNVDHPPTVQSGNIEVPEGSNSTVNLVATDQDGDVVCLQFPRLPPFATAPLSVCGPGSTAMPIQLAPSYSDAGVYPFRVSLVSTMYLAIAFGTIKVTNVDRLPVLDPIADMTVPVGMTADQAVSASDPDGDAITFTKSSGPTFMTVTTISSTTGKVHLAPGVADPGGYAATVRATDGIVKAGVSRAFTITVTAIPNRCPVANAGGPYSGIEGVPLDFDGTGSSDPDGNPLLFAWDFDAADGVGSDAVGPTPSHTFSSAGTRTVTLTVTDNAATPCSEAATTTATVLPSCPATVMNGYDTIRLGAGRPTWFAFVQPATDCYSNTDVRPSTFVMKYGGREIGGNASKTSIEEDKNDDGTQEIRATFSKTALRSLFTGAGLTGGHNLVTVTIEASLTSGGRIQGMTQVDVVPGGAPVEANVSPNPLNPEATLTFTVSKPGPMRIEMFDVRGRLIRSLLEEDHMVAGIFDLKIDGFDSRGRRLPSGVYFIRGTSSEGGFKRSVTILK